MLKLFILVISVLMNVVWVETGGDFKCYPNQTIHFTNPNSGLYTYYRAFYDEGGLINCTATDYNSYADIFFNCGSTTATVTAYFSSRSLSNDNVLGGQSITYTFVCNPINTYEDTLTDELDISVTETAESATAEYDITAAFYNSPDNVITEATVGDVVVFIITSPAEFTLLPKNCTAYGDNGESAVLIINGCSKDTSLMFDFLDVVIGQNRLYGAEFYVFKFYNSDSVTIECLVKVCPGSGDCSYDDICDDDRRRRRDDGYNKEKDDNKLTTVGSRLRIVDRALGGTNNIKGSCSIVMSLLLFVWRI